MNTYDKIVNLGQVPTSQPIVSEMLALKKNNGTVLEPSCGAGAFLKHLNNAVGIEIDQEYRGKNVLNIDFFDYDVENKFDTIIGNPPYVKFQDIIESTKLKLNMSLFDNRSNLYLFFIYKCILHLKSHGELIFINPRDFLKSTSSIHLNKFIYDNGTITDLIDLGDKKIFGKYTPNCIIWRFEKNNFTRKTSTYKEFILSNGQLLFTNNQYPIQFKDVFFVKVGAVSGADKIFSNDEYGNADFVCSFTAKKKKTRKMIFNEKSDYLNAFKDILIKRRIKKFDENNWWKWGRLHYQSDEKRIYVNCKTRNKEPFFLHPSNYYDGSILAVFPKNQKLDLNTLCAKLNKVDWFELGFVCDGRFIFNQKSLENCMLPDDFLACIKKSSQKMLVSK
jgi:adenine-specific DNA-methyltransferase